MVFRRKFCENAKILYLNPILGNLEVTHDLGWWLVRTSMVDVLFALIELFFAIFWFRSHKAKCLQLGCFHRGRPLCTQTLPGHGCPPSTILFTRKLETLSYSTVKIASFCLPSFWQNTGVWRTDRRTDEFAVTYTALARLALACCKRVAVFVELYNCFYLFTDVADKCAADGVLRSAWLSRQSTSELRRRYEFGWYDQPRCVSQTDSPRLWRCTAESRTQRSCAIESRPRFVSESSLNLKAQFVRQACFQKVQGARVPFSSGYWHRHPSPRLPGL